MRIAYALLLLTFVLFASPVLAQETPDPPRQFASPSDVNPADLAPPVFSESTDAWTGGKATKGGKGCGNACGKGCGCGGEAWTLMEHWGRQNDPWQFSGWLNGGVMVNMTNNDVRNDPIPFSNPSGEFLFNQVWMSLERVADNGGCGFDWGARVDFVFGADGPDTSAFGDGSWDFDWRAGGEYGSAAPQFYLELLYNDVNIKVGRFFTILGYEVVPAPGNFFYSHSYAMTYGEPFTHTGVLAETPWNENTTLYGGYTFGWDAGFENRGEAHTMIGGFQRQVNDFTSLTYAFTYGRYGNGLGPSGNLGDIYSHSIVLDVQLTERSNAVLVHDLAANHVNGAMGNAEWYGLSGYYFYQINDCWTAGMRAEWFDDADGLRISTVNDGFNDLHYWELTFGLNYRRSPNLMIRPEVRMDWATSHSDNDFNDIYVNNTRDNLQTFAVDFILTY